MKPTDQLKEEHRAIDGRVGVQLLKVCQHAQCSLVWANLPALADADLIEETRIRLEQLNTNAKGIP